MRVKVVLAALALSLWVGAAQAATVERLTLGRLVELSERVFIGTVTAQASRLSTSPRQVWTDTTFRVEQVLKGDKDTAPFTLTLLGGEAGEGADRLRQVVHGYPTFQVGERVVLFLERTPKGFVVTGLAQGKFTVTEDAKTGRPMAVRDVSDLAFIGAHVATRTFLGAPADPNRLPLDQLVTVVRGGVPLATPVVVRPAAVETPQVSLPGKVAR